MRHVDDGTIHSWLDGQITDPGEVAWIEEHLNWCAACGAKMADERAALEQAHSLLAVAAPASEPPSFQELAARADAGIEATPIGGAPVWSDRHHRWLLQAGWAASIVLAVGIGWMVRGVTDRDSTIAVAEPAAATSPVAEREAPSVSIESVQGATQSARASDAGTTPLGQTARLTGATSQQAAAATARLREELRRGGAALIAQPRRAAPSGVLPPPPMPAPALVPQTGVANAEASAPAADMVSSARAIIPDPPPVAERPSAAPPALAETVVVTGPAAETMTVQVPSWQMVPRTVAAVRTGMPLYGIAGLESVYTAISADQRSVRTGYRLESGAVIELEQQGATSPPPPPWPSLQAIGSGFATGERAARAVGALDAVPPRVWSVVRSGTRLSLRTTTAATDLEALGAKLRIE